MGRNIKITAGSVGVSCELADTPTAKAILEALPIKGQAQRWGGEIYFSIPVSAELEPDARDVLEAGELGYWPTGNALCIFFGKTPASQADEIRAASDVNVFGRVSQDLSSLHDVPNGSEVVVELVE